ncbi:hypothetical protein GGS21DRAFT_310617 [Xylaria nigripes]|nr:hypothetical protein GGS21DRAFT_310617 [Xylaria nigripes]
MVTLRSKSAFQSTHTKSQSLSDYGAWDSQNDADDERSTISSPALNSGSIYQPSESSSSESQARATPNQDENQSPSQPRPSCTNKSSHVSSLGAWLDTTGQSLNSVRPPDPIYENHAELPPETIVHIPPFLFRPRPPPRLRQGILSLPLRNVLRRYNLFAKLVDDYQQWHGRQVFAFWTVEEETFVQCGLASPELAAAYDDRPSVPPRVLAAPFQVALLAAPLLSHLIERYHRDLGSDYFAFFHEDPRGYRSDSDNSLRLVCWNARGA